MHTMIRKVYFLLVGILLLSMFPHRARSFSKFNQRWKKMALTYGSVCSGIEAPTVAWHELGWLPLWFAEIESFPSAVLEHYYPRVPNLGDMTTIADKIRSREIEAPDILIGGTPCQAFSVAGLRNSLNDDRGQLTLAFIELANAIDEVRKVDGKEPVIIIWENVPRVLSTKDNAFGCLLGAIAGENCELEPAGAKWKNAGFLFGPERSAAWRILDAQFFGVPQRRRRVFVIGSARDGFRPEKILFEFGGVRRDSAPIRSTRKEIARALRAGTKSANRTRSWISHKDPIGTLCKSDEKGLGNQSVEDGKILFDADLIFCANDNAADDVALQLAPTLRASTGCKPISNVHGALSFQQNSRDEVRAVGGDGEIAGALTSKQGMHNQNFICDGVVRRLTPLECERLQGFPDNYTRIPYKGKSLERCPDTKRYAALGNSMAVPVMKWIGTRIDKYLLGEL